MSNGFRDPDVAVLEALEFGVGMPF